jgi:diguanylate cyclase (GGDEF)-like protein/PAS domain S-box-containing protein
MIGEEGFRALFNMAADSIFILDSEGFIKVVNQIGHERLGYSRDEMLGRQIGSFILPEFAAMLDSRLAKVLEQGHLMYESAQVRKDGSVLPVEISTRTIELSGQQAFFSIVRDISERKLMDNALRESEHRFRTLAVDAPEAIVIHDLETGLFVDATSSAERMFGYSHDEILRRGPQHFFAPDQPVGSPTLESIRERGEHILAGEQMKFEQLVRNSKGQDIHCEIRLVGLPSANRKLIRASYIDITERKRDQRLLEMMKFSIDHMGDKVTWVTSDAKVVYANIAACKSLGYTMEEMLKLSVPDFDPDFSVEDWPSHWEELKKHSTFTFESRHRAKGGEISPVEVSVNYMRFDDEEYNCAYVRDITKRKQMEEALQLSSMVLHNSSEGMLVTDEKNQIISVNPAFSNITGYSFEEVQGKNPRMFKSDRHDPTFYRAMWHEIISTGKWQGEVWDKRKNGETHAKWLTINTIRNNDGSIHRYVALFSDITEKKKSEQLIWRQANFDTLTGLPNRDMFRDRLGLEVKKSDRACLSLALLLVDLDQFKEVNDTLGHIVGDLLLQEAATRICACVRESDTVARLGGDEFTVVLSAIAEASHVEDVAQKIVSKLAEPFHLGSEVVYVSASIGITLYPNDATDIDVLMKNADQAMYVAKNKGRNRFSYFTPSLQKEAQNRLRLITDLRGALEAKQFRVHFQPIVELSTGLIHKAEALIRWQHPERGMVSPAEFIPLAEETGLINEIGDWVFKESARWAKFWSNLCLDSCQLSVNMSPVQFQHGSKICDEWVEYLGGLGLSGKHIVIEITEGLLLNAESIVTDNLLRFRDAGIQVAIDDFGTGYSSLSYLKKFDIDYLKIDRSFVNNLETDANDMALSEAIIVMAHKLGLKVIAEGVETEGQRDILAAAGCDYAQGYLFSKPVPPEEFEHLLNSMGQK